MKSACFGWDCCVQLISVFCDWEGLCVSDSIPVYAICESTGSEDRPIYYA